MLKEKNFLITTQLLDQFSWLSECPDSWKERAYKGLRSVLFRKYDDEMSPQIKRGLAWEKAIMSSFWDSRESFVERFGECTGPFWDMCRKGRLQASGKEIVDIHGRKYCLYGKADVIQPGVTIDIKTTHSYRGPHTYTGKAQAFLYRILFKNPAFKYMVAIFFDPKDASPEAIKAAEKPAAVEIINMLITEEEARQNIYDRIAQFELFLDTEPELRRAFEEVYTQF